MSSTDPPPYDATESQTSVQNDVHYISSRGQPYNTVPIEMDCPHCQHHIVTHIEKVAGLLPWVLCFTCGFIGLIFFIMPWFFCCLPFFLDPCLDIVHTCPACKKFLGRYKRV